MTHTIKDTAQLEPGDIVRLDTGRYAVVDFTRPEGGGWWLVGLVGFAPHTHRCFARWHVVGGAVTLTTVDAVRRSTERLPSEVSAENCGACGGDGVGDDSPVCEECDGSGRDEWSGLMDSEDMYPGAKLPKGARA